MTASTTVYPVAADQLPPLDRQAGSYRLRFGFTPADLEAVQRLRFEVFNRELGEGLAASWATGRDADPWDETFHHIVIEHQPSGDVVGSYRLQTGDMAERYGGYYSEVEFDLKWLPGELLRASVEIGRACVRADHRNGRVIHLLWRGLAAYLLWNEKRYLFGCCSIPSQQPTVGIAAWRQLKLEGFVSSLHSVTPRHGLACESGGAPVPQIQRNELPPLLQSYLNLGAEICGPPAIDADFGTIDFMVLLDLQNLDERSRRQFFRDLPERQLPRTA